MNKETVLQNISNKEKIGGIIWIVVASIQLIIGLIYNWVTLIIGIWNLIIGITRLTNASRMEKRENNIVEEYEKSLVNMIIFLVLNIFIGGIIGVIGAIYDLVTRSYVINCKDIIMNNTSTSSNSKNSNKYENLEKLMKLKQDGILTDTEFEVEKQKLLK